MTAKRTLYLFATVASAVTALAMLWLILAGATGLWFPLIAVVVIGLGSGLRLLDQY